MGMPPSTVTSSLHPSNKDAIAWNDHGILAIGCHSTLVFLDARRLKVFQTLEQHATAINLVSWPPPCQLIQTKMTTTDNGNAPPPPSLKCASSDINGNIFVWDVRAGTVLASFRHSNTPVTDLKWLNWPSQSSQNVVDFAEDDLPPLLSLHSNTWLICWRVGGKQERQWEHKFPTPVFKISLDPFEPGRMAMASTGCTLLLLDGIITASSPPNSTATIDSSPSSNSTAPPPIQMHSMGLEPRTVGAPVAKSTVESAIVQLRHHAAFPHLLFVLFANELCLVECQHRQVLYSAIVDVGAPIIQILPCARRDALFLVHQNGLCSFRLAHIQVCEERVSASLDYERKCFAEAMPRQSARLRVMGAALCPTTNSTLALLMNSGRVLFYQLEEAKQHIEPYRIRCLEDLVQLDPADCQNKCPPLRLTQHGCYSPLSTTATVIRMRPPIQEEEKENHKIAEKKENEGKNAEEMGAKMPSPPHRNQTQLDGIGQHLGAVGTSAGIVHLLDVFGGKIVRDFQVHTFPVKCLEWAGPNAIVSAAYIASLSSSSTVRNDLFLTDIQTGVKRRIRPEQEESPVEAIRVSYYSSYLAISFRQHPLEIWDLGTQRLLRRMNKRCPVIVDLCWSGKHHQAKIVGERTRIYRENLVVLDNDNHLYHVVVKGLHVRDGKEVSTQWKSGAALLRCMVWKEDILAFGDSAGRVGVWDLARSQCRQSGLSQSTRGPVQRIVFSKLAGDYTLAAQHPTSLVVWDTEKLSAIFSLQRPGLSIIDVDMCGLTPVYLTSDGMFRMALSTDNEGGRNGSSAISDSEMPLLLQPAYIEAVHQMAAATTISEPIIPTENEEEICPPPSLINQIDPDSDFLLAQFAQKRGPLQRLAFAHQFVGQPALANFCRVVESAKDREEAEPLPTDLLLFWGKNAYKKRMELLTRLLLSTCRNEQQLEQAIEKCIIMKKNELAMYYLLNNEQLQMGGNSSRDTVRLNAFRACILSANFDSEEAKCLVKLTATNLIASNFVSEGIQLLSLIDQGLDGCKYLISQGLWERSLIYSKINPNCDFVEIYQRYAEHLASEAVGRKSLALMVLASLGGGGNNFQSDRFAQMIEGTAMQRILEMAQK